METGISAGKIIYKHLSTNVDLKAIVGEKIYPIVAREGVSFPFVTFELGHVQPKNAHNYDNRDDVAVIVTCLSDKYNEAVECAEAARGALEFYGWEFVDAQDDYQDGVFAVIVNFKN